MNKNSYKNFIQKYCPVSFKDSMMWITVIGICSFVCYLIGKTTTSDTHVPLIFVSAVVIISLETEGYFYGLLASVVGVFAVNWAFTYPYFKLDFSVYGYPITFITMFTVSILVSTMTTRMRAHEKLIAETEKERVRANLLRAISHDLRTPLTSISGALTIAIEDDSLNRDALIELLSGAKDDADWLNRMVTNILSITRINSAVTLGKTEEMPEEIIASAISSFKKQHPDIEIDVSVPEDPVFIPVDPMLIEQVLINLMENAAVHGVTTTKISIIVKTVDSGVEIAVNDNGRGIDKTTLKELFKASGVLDKGHSSDETRGMGIGLLLCRTIVEAHGGAIYAKNLKNGGASFVFTLSDEEKK